MTVRIEEISHKTLRSYVKKTKPHSDAYNDHHDNKKVASANWRKKSFDYDRMERHAIGHDNAKFKLDRAANEKKISKIHDHLTSNGYKHKPVIDSSGTEYAKEYHKEDEHNHHRVEVKRYHNHQEPKVEHKIVSKKYGHALWTGGPGVAPVVHHSSTKALSKFNDKDLYSITTKDADKSIKEETLDESELEYCIENMTVADYMQLDELSKDTLKSYVDKSRKARSNLARGVNKEMDKGWGLRSAGLNNTR